MQDILTCDMWHVTHGGGELSLKMSAPQILLFEIDSVLKILNENITQWMNELMNNQGVYRTAPATPGLLNIQSVKKSQDFIVENLAFSELICEDYLYFS